MGAALGKAGLARRTSLGMSTLVIASNLPDVDVAVFATQTLAVSFRRGWTHGVLAQALLPVMLTAAMIAYDRLVVQRRPRPGHTVLPANASELLLLSYIGVLSHVFMDLLNSYGVRLLMPFSGQWFFGDALFIIDPWLYLVLGAGWWFARRRETSGRGDGRTPARAGVAVATLYMLVMLGSNVMARRVVTEGLVRAGRPESTKFMVSPVPINPFRREVVVDVGDRYEKGVVVFAPWPRFRPAGFGIDKGLTHPLVQTALETPRARAYLLWSRFPFVAIDSATSPPAVWINDYRYANAGPYGWSAQRIR